MTASPALLPDIPALAAGLRRAVWLTADGEIEELDLGAAKRRLRDAPPPLVAHMRALARRLDTQPFPAFDVLELWAFVRPARFCLPTPRGLARALHLPEPRDLADEAVALQQAAEALLAELAAAADREALAMAQEMARAGWAWGPAVVNALGHLQPGGRGFAVWRGLPEIPEHAPPPPAGSKPVEPDAARRRLGELLGTDAEPRPSQADYASAASAAFAPREQPRTPIAVLAEAGTGVGKTLGYLAPASLWAELNEAPVWVSTYTRNLQQQIDQELDRLYPRAEDKALKAVVRKGRENYLCLLNLEEAARALPARPQDAAAIGIMARWAAATRDGDLTGSDFPGWLPDLLGRGRSVGLADRRGECIYSACQHYDRCFVERSVRRARRADIVVANHALVMVQAAIGGEDDTSLPTRLVFDEGHHVFDAADGAFSAHLSAIEGEELRRWLLGAEGGRSRARGLKRRVEELLGENEGAHRDLVEILRAARELPGEGWPARLAEGRPATRVEAFLAKVRQQVLARSDANTESYGMEADARPPVEGMVDAAAAAAEALSALRAPVERLRNGLLDRLEREADDLETITRQRIEAIARSLQRRALIPLGGWIGMLQTLDTETPLSFVDWLQIERAEGRELDVGMYRHWIDPTVPFAAAIAGPTHGMLVTSATLTDGTGDAGIDWHAAEARVGTGHLATPAIRASVASPFDYANQTRVLVVNDVRKDDLGQVAAAYRVLFEAAGGGALGLFTAISRLRAVHGRIAGPLEAAGIQLLAQHVDGMETASLIDIFRAEEDACLLGTDAVRDGVDVPGRSLRLIVFDRVPWPRPTLLHKARRSTFGGRAYDDMLTRLKLKQAFGRLVRRASDHGVFVLLDPMMPTRLCGAFPPGVEVQRLGLADAVAITRDFLQPASTASR